MGDIPLHLRRIDILCSLYYHPGDDSPPKEETINQIQAGRATGSLDLFGANQSLDRIVIGKVLSLNFYLESFSICI